MTLHELPQRPRPNQDLEVRAYPAREQGLDLSGEREVGAIVTHMWENAEQLARQEIALGLAELQVRADKLKKSLVDGAIMGAVFHAGALLLVASLVLGLSEVMAPWLAALIVAVVSLAGGYVAMKRSEQNAIEAVADTQNPRTQRTVRAMKEGLP